MAVAPSRRDILLDGLLAVTATALGVSSVITTDPTVAYDYPPANGWLILLAVGAGLPLAGRRVFPFTVLAVSLAAISAIMLLRWNEGITPLCTAAALYAVAVHRPLRVAIAAVLLVLGAFTVFALAGAPFFDSPAAVLSAAVFMLPWGIGLAVRHQMAAREEAVARAVEAERNLAVAAERAVFADRLRIAREMHDIVAHTLSVVSVQSGVARYLLVQDPTKVEPALTVIEQASRSALEDLRRLLGVLRASDEVDGMSARQPIPGLVELQGLADTHRSTQGPVRLDIDPTTDASPASVRLAVFRIVQEGLTNARKHAPRAAVRISVGAAGGAVDVEVVNDPVRVALRHVDDASTPNAADVGRSGEASGYGLAGVRERVAAFGGQLEAGPTIDGGFRLHAVLPCVVTPEEVLS